MPFVECFLSYHHIPEKNNLLIDIASLHKMRIFLVETNGLPNLSDGETPDIKSLGYGIWASEVLEKLKIEKAFIAGASFGGLICMKLAIVKPEVIKSVLVADHYDPKEYNIIVITFSDTLPTFQKY